MRQVEEEAGPLLLQAFDLQLQTRAFPSVPSPVTDSMSSGKRRVTEETMEVRSRCPWMPHLFLVLLLPHVLLSTGQSSYSPSGWRNVYEDTGSPRRRRGCNPAAPVGKATGQSED
ncbi:Mpn Domain-Containing Protein [Manis pentadactyla]|nr:Mpn Domain-Containing Protein [Manis pentadactyla]